MSNNILSVLVGYLNGTSNSDFGSSLAVAGNYLVVGAPLDSQAQGSGAVYVFASVGGSMYSPVGAAVTGDAISKYFGGVVAAYGNLFAVGAVNTAGKLMPVFPAVD
jgi:hypothetical protein